ncbi:MULTISPECIES: DUF262 domain-containing protein [unclassified Synechococcus]|uniref:GmrSD restriction endonuclease domain-containing protein n=1 Tax=unclassified Synechococcus TaxID=2626047 RepID=UPI00336BBAAE
MMFTPGTWNISHISRLAGAQELVLQPDYQRFYIWSNATEQALIDSILRDYPIPPIWLWCHQNSQGRDIWEVIDGQQRLTCIKRFKDNVFAFRGAGLRSTDIHHAASGCYCTDAPLGSDASVLPREMSERFWNYRLNYIEVRTEDRDLIIDIFRRLNKSSTNLNPQELLNAFYNGEFKTMVYDKTAALQDDQFWGSRAFRKQATDRMGAQQFTSELFVALITGQSQNKSEKVEDHYRNYESSYPDKPSHERRFDNALSMIKRLLPGQSRFTSNLSDFYTLFLFITILQEDRKIRLDERNVMTIRSTLEEFEEKLVESNDDSMPVAGRIFEEYRRTIVGAQKEKEIREARFRIISNLVLPGLEYVDTDRVRIFSYEQKLYIWNKSIDKICGICDGIVDSYDDYEPDHILPWSMGGMTTIMNGRVAHQRCNRSRGNDA